MSTTYPLRLLLRCAWLLAGLLLAAPEGAAAQVQDCTFDQPCPQDHPPTVWVVPGGGTYSGAELEVKVHLSDDHRLDGTTFEVWLNGSTNVTSAFRLVFSGSASAQASGTIQLPPGANTLVASICDTGGQCRSDDAVYTYAPPPPPPEKGPPVVSLAPHSQGIRLPSPFDLVVTHGTPAYVSLDVPRSVTLLYSSEQASPSGFVQVDVDVHSATVPDRVSISILDAAGRRVRLTNGQTESFYRAAPGTARLAAQWDASSLATGAHAYTVVVRSWWGMEYREAAHPVRVLVVNERNSPFGVGWSVAGLQRIHVQADGSLVVTEGDGSAVFFTRGACDASGCSYTRPDGAFSTVHKVIHPDVVGEEYLRRYPDGTLLAFASDGRLLTAEDRFGNRTSYGYDGAGRLVSITDPVGKTTTLGYDTGGRLASIRDPGGRATSFIVDRDGYLDRIGDPDGVPALRARYDRGRMTARWDRAGSGWSFDYDAAGKLAASVAPQLTTATGETLRHVARFRSWEAAVLPAPGSGVLQRPAARIPSGAALAEVSDMRGNTTRMALDRWQEPVRVEDPRGKVSTWVRDEHGRVTLATGPQGGSVGFYYGDRNHPYPLTVTEHATGRVFSYEYEPAFYQVEIARGNTTFTRNFYSGRSLLPDSTQVDTVVTRYTHDSRGRLLSVTDPEEHRTNVAYEPDGMQNTESVSVVRGAETRTISYDYDALGRVWTVTDPAERTVTTAYDALNRVVGTTAPGSTTVTYGYDDPARTYTVTDPEGQTYRTALNALGWVESRTDPRGQVERFAYDRWGNLAEYTNRRNQTVAYTYDALDRVETRVADGRTTTYEYDPEERWVRVSNPESVDELRVDVAGRPYAAITTRGAIAYSLEATYTREGLRNALYVSGPWGKRSIGYGYDDALRLDYLRDPGQRETGIVYSKDGLPDQVTLPTGSSAGERLRQIYGYTPLHALAQVGYTREAANDALGRGYGHDVLERVETVTRTSPLGGTETRTLAYDPLGRLKSYQDVRRWEETECTDPLDQLTCQQVSRQAVLRGDAYTYDRVGNRTDRGAVLETGNRLTQFDGYTLEYDADGNLERKHRAGVLDQTFTWNSLGELESVSTNGSTTTYGYDGLGRRVRKSTPGGTVRYLWDGDDLVAEVDGSGTLLREYAYYPGVDRPHSVRRSSDGAVFYYGTELPGHVAGLVSAGNQVVNTYQYTPWGERIGASEQVAQPLGFTAREQDAESGLVYLRNRYYDPGLGRFISEDPIGLEGGINPYAYAGNDPANNTDPYLDFSHLG